MMEWFDDKRLESLLLAIDEEALLELGKPSTRYRMVIVGSAVLLLSHLAKRSVTQDIDIIQVDHRIADIVSRYPMINGAASAYIDQLPYNFEDRLIRLPLGTQVIEYLIPSLEGIVVMKLYAWRDSDREDLLSEPLIESLDLDLLERLVNDPGEAGASALSERRYQEMVSAYERYRLMIESKTS